MSQTTTIPYASIDLGYFQTKYLFSRGKDEVAHRGLLPSIAPIVQEPKTTRGADLNNIEVDKGFYIGVEREVRYVGTDARSKDSSAAPRTIELDWCLSPEYRAIYLGTLAHIARQAGATEELVIQLLVVGLPALNHPTYKDRLTKMSKGSFVVPSAMGKRLNVVVEECACLMQPQGALAKATGLHRSDALIVDMGGGTIDWFGIIDGKGSESRRGSARLGMITCARAGLRPLSHDLYQDQLFVTRFAAALCEPGTFSFSIGNEPVPQVDLDAAYKASCQKANEALDNVLEGAGDFARYGHIVFTGGGAAFLSRVFLTRYPKFAAKAILDDSPLFSIAEGFLAYAKNLHACRTSRAAA